MQKNPMIETGTSESPQGYRGETLQVFVFYRGQYLGYQCFAQNRVTIGGLAKMDFRLPDCTEEDGYWGFFISGGTLNAWYRNPVNGSEPGRDEVPRTVEPMEMIFFR